jgi:hypothetical protein
LIVAPTKWLDYNHPAANTMSQDAVKIRALAVDDHPLLREGIALIADETDIALVGDRTPALSSTPERNTGVHVHTGSDSGAETCEDT